MTRRCRFCRDRLSWSVELQEWWHHSTGEVQAADGHYPEVRAPIPPFIFWTIIAIMVLGIIVGVIDLLT